MGVFIPDDAGIALVEVGGSEGVEGVAHTIFFRWFFRQSVDAQASLFKLAFDRKGIDKTIASSYIKSFSHYCWVRRQRHA